MDYGSILSMGMSGQMVTDSGGGSTIAAENTGISFNDMLSAFVTAKNAVPARVSVQSVASAASVDIPNEVVVAADSPIIAAVKMLQRADSKTLTALDDLAKASGGEIVFEDLTAEELTAMVESILEGADSETLGKLNELLEAFRQTGAEKIAPETMFLDPEAAKEAVAAAKESLASIASDLFPSLYETPAEALADAADFPVQVKLIPLVIVGEKSLTIEIPGETETDDVKILSLSTDEIFETDKILDQLDKATLTRIQELLQNSNVSIYEAVRALAAVPAEATQANTDGVVGLAVAETDFFKADDVLARIAANNPPADMVSEISFTDESKTVLEELQNIVREVIIKEAPAPTVTIKVDPLFEQRFRERILNVFAGETPEETDSDEPETTYTIRPEMTAHVVTNQFPTPIDEIGMQPSPFIGTGSEVPPEMQIGNRILEMKAENAGDGTQEMTVVLRPRELGDVAVKIVTENGAITVTLTAANTDTAKLIDRGALTLTSQLQSGGLNVKEVLTITPSEASENMGLDFSNGQFQSRGGEQNTGNGQQGSHRALGEETLPSEIDGQFTPDDFIMRRMSLWRSV
jgi:flagellar hook-length control protein FliK